MDIEGLNQPKKPNTEEVGIFKLKDRDGRNAVQIDFSKAKYPIENLKYLYIIKILGENSKIKVVLEWKDEEPKETVLENEKVKVTQKEDGEGISQLTEAKK